MQYLTFLWPLKVLTQRPVAEDHNRMVLSNADAKIYSPLGEKVAKETGGLLSSINVF